MSEPNLATCRVLRTPWLSDSISTDLVSCKEVEMPSAQVWMARMLAWKVEGELSRLVDTPAGSPSFQMPIPVPFGVREASIHQRGSFLMEFIVVSLIGSTNGTFASTLFYHIDPQGSFWPQRLVQQREVISMADWQGNGSSKIPGKRIYIHKYRIFRDKLKQI